MSLAFRRSQQRSSYVDLAETMDITFHQHTLVTFNRFAYLERVHGIAVLRMIFSRSPIL